MTPNPDDERARRARLSEQRDPAHRGRRKADQIFDGWTYGRVIKVATALTLLAGLYAGVSTFLAARVATRKEVGDMLAQNEGVLLKSVDVSAVSSSAVTVKKTDAPASSATLGIGMIFHNP